MDDHAMRGLPPSALLIALLAVAPTVNAATANFDFTSTSGQHSSISFTQNNILVTVTAGDRSSFANDRALVTGNQAGLGVISIAPEGSSFGFPDSSAEINTTTSRFGGFNLSNFLTLTFNKEVLLSEIDFSDFFPSAPGQFGGEAFNLSVNGTLVGSQLSADPFIAMNVFSALEVTGTSIEIGASRSGSFPLTFDSFFFLAGVTVSTIGDTTIPVPLPSGLPLSLGAMALLLAAGRRYRNLSR